MPSSLHSAIFLHHSLKWSHLNSYHLSPQGCEHKVLHPCLISMSPLLPRSLFYITDALISALCIDFLLLLVDTLEVIASSSNREVTGFTSVVGRTLLPLAQLYSLPSLQSGWIQLVCLCCLLSSKNRLKAGECPCRKSLAEYVSKLHPLQPNQAKWQMFSLSKGKQPASLFSSVFLFSRRKQVLQQAFLHPKSTKWVPKKPISQQFLALRFPVSSSSPW